MTLVTVWYNLGTEVARIGSTRDSSVRMVHGEAPVPDEIMRKKQMSVRRSWTGACCASKLGSIRVAGRRGTRFEFGHPSALAHQAHLERVRTDLRGGVLPGMPMPATTTTTQMTTRRPRS